MEGAIVSKVTVNPLVLIKCVCLCEEVYIFSLYNSVFHAM